MSSNSLKQTVAAGMARIGCFSCLLVCFYTLCENPRRSAVSDILKLAQDLYAKVKVTENIFPHSDS